MIINDHMQIVSVSEKVCEIIDSYQEMVVGETPAKFTTRDQMEMMRGYHYRRLLGDKTLPDLYRTTLIQRGGAKIPGIMHACGAYSDEKGNRFSVLQVGRGGDI